MDSLKFKSLEDLYRKVLPALKTRVSELKRNKISIINEIDIWNYLRITNWSKKRDLSLGEMVNDILNTPSDELINYVSNKK